MHNLFEDNGAEFSSDQKRRYMLWRIWDKNLPLAMPIGLNPSTANADKDDQTISYLKKMLKKLGYGGFYMMNCWAYIASKPELLEINPMFESLNNNYLKTIAPKCKDVIFAWGTFKIIKQLGRDRELIRMYPNAKCFGKNADGSPFHPLAMMPRNGRDPNNADLIPYMQ